MPQLRSPARRNAPTIHHSFVRSCRRIPSSTAYFDRNGGATALAPPFLSKYAVDDGIRRHDLTKLWWIVGAFLLAGLLNWGMSYVQTYLTGWVGERILADLRTDLFAHLQRLSLGFYERIRAGVLISRLTNDVEATDQL